MWRRANKSCPDTTVFHPPRRNHDPMATSPRPPTSPPMPREKTMKRSTQVASSSHETTSRWRADAFLMHRLHRKDHWVYPSRRTLCAVCHLGFSLLARKHNCHMCGDVVCRACLAHIEVESAATRAADASIVEACVCLDCLQDHVNLTLFVEVSHGVALKAPYAAASSHEPILATRDASKFDSTVVLPRRSSTQKTTTYSSQASPIKVTMGSSSINAASSSSWRYAWPPPPSLPDDDARVTAVKALGILDTPPEDVFDVACTMASHTYDCPIAGVSFLTRRRQWLKASIGLSQNNIPRKVSLCAHTIATTAAMVVLDAPQDERFAKNPLVTGMSAIRFYAGTPIVDGASGFVLGTVFVMDRHPRQTCDPRRLEALAAAVAEVVAADQRFRAQEMRPTSMSMASARESDIAGVQALYAIVRKSIDDRKLQMPVDEEAESVLDGETSTRTLRPMSESMMEMEHLLVRLLQSQRYSTPVVDHPAQAIVLR
ncbi:Aste57867_15350 [Aphanomyces stellatus]|uniref:Aste57867_15350 protein n=1 Tax=Aphanomyces stellatus TaxID=120398 RepID=A0A485L4T0_9STRA|nr:hypothetical protein As57867_015294 [Aphanomyces stellatus]VFT92158.1 Aste57867_15350 [Aphanomyces stellatus]